MDATAQDKVRTLIIYGGMHKTGTSSVQNTIFQNVGLLNSYGVEVVRSGLETKMPGTGVRHLHLSRELRICKGLGDRWKAAMEEVMTGPYQSYILMHENFFNPRLNPSMICDAFPDVNVKMIACTRNPIDYLQSQYREKIHRGNEFREPGEFVRRNAAYLKFKRIQKMWEDRIGSENVACISYEDNKTGIEDAVIGAILDYTSVPLNEIRNADRVNDRISDTQCLMYFIANKMRRNGVDIDVERVKNLSLPFDIEIGPARTLSDEVISQIVTLSDQPGVYEASATARLPFNTSFFDDGLRKQVSGLILDHISRPTAPSATTVGLPEAVCIGIQRNDAFLIEIGAKAPLPDNAEILIKEVSEEAEPHVLHKITVSECLIEVPELAELKPKLTRPSARKLSAHGQHLYGIRFALTESRPVRGLVVAIKSGENESECPWLSNQLSLSLRIPKNSDEFKSRISFKRGRSIDAETIFFSCMDTLKSHNFKKNEQIDAYIANCFVIFIYKAIELQRGDIDSFVLGLTPKIRTLISGISSGSGVREDDYQARLSLDTALWHFWISRSDMEQAQTKLFEMRDNYKAYEGQFKITYAFNLALSMLALGVATLSAGDDRAEAILLDVYDIFRRGSAVDTRHVTWFEELLVSHKAAHTALRVLELRKNSQPMTAEIIEATAQHCSRVKTPDFQRKLTDFLTGHNLRAPVEAKISPA